MLDKGAEVMYIEPVFIASDSNDDRSIKCYDVSKDSAYDSSYFITTVTPERTVYAYFEDTLDMFYIYDILIRA